jgi:hypothetical protein
MYLTFYIFKVVFVSDVCTKPPPVATAAVDLSFLRGDVVDRWGRYNAPLLFLAEGRLPHAEDSVHACTARARQG